MLINFFASLPELCSTNVATFSMSLDICFDPLKFKIVYILLLLVNTLLVPCIGQCAKCFYRN
jgi:hypothetical protein